MDLTIISRSIPFHSSLGEQPDPNNLEIGKGDL